MNVRAGVSNRRKAPFATADKAVTRGRHGAWQEQREKYGGQRNWERAEPSGVGENFGGRKASGVDPETHRVGGGGRGL